MKVILLILSLLISNFIVAQKNIDKKHRFSIETPFVIDTCKDIIINATIDNQPLRFLLSISYSQSYIDSKYKHKKSKYPLKIGNFTFDNTKLKAINLEDGSLGHYDGILGNDFFSQGILQIDYSNQKIRFAAQSRDLDNLKNQPKIPIHHLYNYSKAAFIPLRIDGNYVVDLCLSNNLKTTLLLPKPTYTLVAPKLQSKKYTFFNNHNKIDTSSSFFLDAIKLHDSISLRNNTYCSDWHSEDYFGYLNVDNLKCKTLTIDWQNQMCYFNQNKMISHLNHLTYSFEKGNSLKIQAIMLDSPILKAGMMPNDIIKSINDVEVHNENDIENIFLDNPTKDNVFRYKILRNQKEMDFEVKF